MERRQKDRTPADIAALLNYPPLGLLGTRIRDISSTGAFVQSRSIRLNLHYTVELLASVPCQERLVNPIRATVVRITRDGAGLKFLEPDPGYPESLNVSPTCNVDNREPRQPSHDKPRAKIFS